MRRAAAALLAALLVLPLTGCRSNDEIEQDRLRTCLAAGGSYWADEDESDYSCTLPNVPNPHR